MGTDTWYPGLVSVVRAVCCWCSVFWLFTGIEGEIRGIHLGAYLAFGLVCFVFFACFLRRERGVPALAAAGAILSAAGSVLLLWKCSDLIGFWNHLFAIASVITVVFVSARANLGSHPAARSISGLDGCAVFFLFFLWVLSMWDADLRYALPLLAAVLLSLSAVTLQRLSAVGETAPRGRLRGFAVAGGAAVVIAGLMLLFMAFGAEALGQGTQMLWQGVRYCLRMLWRGLEYVMTWLAALIPDLEGEAALPPSMEMPPIEGQPEEIAMPEWVMALLGIAGFCLALGVAAFVLFQLRKLRFKGGRVPRRTVAVQRRKRPIGRWLRQLWSALKNRLHLMIALLTMRGDPRELYLFLRHAGRRLGHRQQPGETPCAFVRRAGTLAREEELARALEELAQALEICLYAPQKPLPLSGQTARCIRRGFRRMLRKSRRERWKERLRAKRADRQPA